MKKLLGIVVLGLLWPSLVNATTYAVEFTESSLYADFTIEVSTSSLYADETWNLVGSCRNEFNYSTIEISESSLYADKTIDITTNSLYADRDICIKNPDSLPEWFLEMLN